jgi:hypothetical protein
MTLGKRFAYRQAVAHGEPCPVLVYLQGGHPGRIHKRANPGTCAGCTKRNHDLSELHAGYAQCPARP